MVELFVANLNENDFARIFFPISNNVGQNEKNRESLWSPRYDDQIKLCDEIHAEALHLNIKTRLITLFLSLYVYHIKM